MNQIYSNGFFFGYSLGDNNYEGAQSNVNDDEVRV